MGNVIPIRQLDPSESVKRALSDLNARSNTERFRGFIFLMETEDGEQVVGASGLFATDLGRAAKAAKAGFECLLGNSRFISEVDTKLELPRRLRKEKKDEAEESHRVVVRNMPR